MARFSALTRDRIQELTARRGSGLVDLTEHKNWIQQASRDGWGEITLDPGDNVRAIKRRTTIAGKELSKVVKWHRKSNGNTLIFQVMDPAQVTKRQRRARGS